MHSIIAILKHNYCLHHFALWMNSSPHPLLAWCMLGRARCLRLLLSSFCAALLYITKGG